MKLYSSNFIGRAWLARAKQLIHPHKIIVIIYYYLFLLLLLLCNNYYLLSLFIIIILIITIYGYYLSTIKLQKINIKIIVTPQKLTHNCHYYMMFGDDYDHKSIELSIKDPNQRISLSQIAQTQTKWIIKNWSNVKRGTEESQREKYRSR